MRQRQRGAPPRGDQQDRLRPRPRDELTSISGSSRTTANLSGIDQRGGRRSRYSLQNQWAPSNSPSAICARARASLKPGSQALEEQRACDTSSTSCAS